MVCFLNSSVCLLLMFCTLLSAGLLAEAQEEGLIEPVSTPTAELQELVVDSLFNDKELVVDKKSNFSLTCRSPKPVNWTYPHYIPNEDDMRSIPEFYLGEEDGMYVAKLTMYHAYYMDTGYFTCHKLDSDVFVAHVYVYVRDDENFLAINSTMSVVSKLQGDTVEIPCRPTDPSLTVELYKDSEIYEEAQFDPHKGYTFVVESIMQTGAYECVIESIPVLLYHLHVTFPKRTDSIEKPHITVSHLLAAVNANVTFVCSIHHDMDVAVFLDWVLPRPGPNESGHIVKERKKKTEDGRDVTQLTLKIFNVNKEDQGEYTCHVRDQSDNENSNKTTLRVTDHSVLDLFPVKSQDSVHVGIPKEELEVKIESSPEVKYKKWYDFENNLIVPQANPKYVVVTDNQFMSKLSIRRPTIRDSGTYTLKVGNGAFNKSVSINVTFKGIPEVIVNGGMKERFYVASEEHIISCEVFGHPRPSIIWFFTRCPTYPHCGDDRELVPRERYEKHNNERLLLHEPLKSSIRVPRYHETAKFFCVAKNLYTQDQPPEDSTIFLASDVKNGFAIVHPPLVVETDNVTLSCGASKYNYTGEFHWFYEKNGQQSDVFDIEMWDEETELSFWKKLNIPKVTKDNAGIYRCQTTQNGGGAVKITEINMKVEGLLEPKLSVGGNRTEWVGTTGQKVTFRCQVDQGMPPPTVTWYNQTQKKLDGERFKLKDNNQTLTILVGLKDDGKYFCRATNKAGESALEFRVILTDKPNEWLTILGVYVLPVAIALAVLLILVCVFRHRKLKREIKELKEAGLLHFEEGNVESLNQDLDIGDQADLLPYDRKRWEFPRDKLKLGKQLGHGAFGVVLKAEAYELLEQGVATTVAVKMVKRNCDVKTIRALASELKIMIHLGKHLNVVNVLGACTGDLNKRELLVLVEYCQYGNLHDYLVKHRGAFINQVNARTGMFDPSVVQPTTPRSPSGNFHDSPFGMGEVYSNGNTSMRTSAAFSHTTDTTLVQSDMSAQSRPGGRADVSVQSTPVGEDGYLVCKDHEWRNKDRGDYQDGLGPVCTQDLICWGFQIARGMEYLASRKVLHGDLAARNVLLADDNIIKICDFGFSKSMYSSLNYQKKGDEPLPIKWMALESIQDRVFSTQSDVWAYGITLWELFSLASTPYPGMEVNEKLFDKLADGYRMEQPKYSTKQVYQVMVDCWHVNPHSRPSFTELTERMGGMLEDTVRTHYVDLNDPFLQQNSEFLAQRDYLSMLRSPTYTNVTPHNYSVMKPIHRDSEEAMELTPMLGNKASTPPSPDSPDGSPSISKPTGNNYVNVAHVLGFSNPNYHNFGRPKQSPYINMPDSVDER